MTTSPTWRRDRYDVNSANVNREITFRVGAGAAAGGIPNTFMALKGPANQYPHYHQVQGALDHQELAQLRLSYVIRAITQYAIPIGVHVVDTGNGGASLAGMGHVVDIKFEQDEMGVFFNQEWPIDATQDKHTQAGTIQAPTHHPAATGADVIQDTVGTGGMPRGPKEKPGLNGLLDTLGPVSWDEGTTGPFGTDVWGTGDVVLPDGVTVTFAANAPALPVAGARLSGLDCVWIGY